MGCPEGLKWVSVYGKKIGALLLQKGAQDKDKNSRYDNNFSTAH